MKKTFKKFLSILIAVCVVAAAIVLPAAIMPVSAAASVWDGSSESESLSGTGTADDPYLISSGADLKYWQTRAASGSVFAGSYFLLTKDIDIGEHAMYIYRFDGVFDGGNHEIKGIKTVLNTLNNVGFFRTLNGEVKNLTLSGLIWGDYNVGGFAGSIGTAGTKNITNCVNNLTVKSTSTAYGNVGGFVGNASPGNPSTITLNFFSCTNNGTVTSARNNQSNLGGFVGYVSGNTTVNVRYSSNNGEVTNSAGNAATDVGGFIGNGGGIISFDSCVNAGTVSSGYAVGGFVGWMRGNKALTVKNSINVGQINVLRTDGGNGWADGILGVSSSYTGTLTASNVYKLTGCVNFGTSFNNQESNAKLIGTEVAVSYFTADNIISSLGYCFTLDDNGVPTLRTYDGKGTKDDPYVISTKEQLIMLSRIVTDSTKQWTNYTDVSFALGADIDLENSTDFLGIGNGYKTFQGDFDGKGFTVSGVYLSTAHYLGTGFFGKIAGTNERHISNLNVQGIIRCTDTQTSGNTDIETKAGGLVGMNDCKLYITDCSFNGTVYTACTNGNKAGAGGLVGYVSDDLVINRCFVSGTVDGFGRSGALVASLNEEHSVAIYSSYSDATVTGVGATDGSNPTAGGLLGFVGGSGVATLDNCFFYGTAPAARGTGYAGPIVNYVEDGSTLTCTYTYYNSDNNSDEVEGHQYGEGKTETEFADGTVLGLINDTVTVYLQGEDYPVFDDRQFTTHALILTGEIGVSFYVDLSDLTDEEKESGYMTFSISAGSGAPKQKTAEYDSTATNAKGHYRFDCFVNSVQMAETITPVFHYSENKTLLGSGFSVRKYINYIRDNSENENLISLVKALGDYGHYAQIYLSGQNSNNWVDGTDYTAMPLYRSTDYSSDNYSATLSQVSGKAITYSGIESGGSSGQFQYTLNFDTTTSVKILFRTGNVNFTSVTRGGENYTDRKNDYTSNTCILYLLHLPIKYLGDTITVSGNADGNSFTIGVSGLSYVQALLNRYSGSATESAVKANDMACALYDYYYYATNLNAPVDNQLSGDSI